jgi:hypothetical protein
MQFYNAGGSALIPPLEMTQVANAESQRTALAGTTAFETLFTLQADVEMPTALLSPAGGGVCVVSETGFGTLDCVAWGTATVAGAGTSEPAIPDGSSITRDVSANCNTLLEPQDDTGSSAADFNPAFATPQVNSEIGVNSTCPNTQLTKEPKAKTKDRTPTFEFTGGGDGFECKIDDGIREDCTSPFKPGKLSRGRHEFEVRAIEDDGSIDGTPESYSWKIVKKR